MVGFTLEERHFRLLHSEMSLLQGDNRPLFRPLDSFHEGNITHETGQAKAISEEIFDQAVKEGFNVARYCLSQVEKKFTVNKESCVVFVCSTTGEGEPPDTASKFVRRIKKKTLSSRFLSDLSFAFLALGDSNYTSFCECGRTIDKRLQELGANHFYETGYADDAVGLEVVVEPWIENLFPALRNHLKKSFTLAAPEIISVVEENISNNNKALTNDNKQNTTEQVITKDANSDIMSETSEIEGTEKVASLGCSIPPLSNSGKRCFKMLTSKSSALKVPACPDAYLEISFLEDEETSTTNKVEYPNAATDITKTTILQARQLTNDPLAKKCLELELDSTDIDFEFLPGDSFGILCENKEEEVNYLISRLKLDDIADRRITLKIKTETKKKAPKIPDYIHLPSTLRNILTKDVDFRAVPRKAFLRMLVEYTENEQEKRRLQELCSVQGTKDYAKFVREDLIGLVEFLKTFESCNPPIKRILELLPRLLPREYSIASSPLALTSSFKFVFNVIELPEFQGQKRFGLCTKALDDLCGCYTASEQLTDITSRLEKLTVQRPQVNVYFRRPTNFRFPEDPKIPLIMIGPGTGVAPFIGFLQHRQFLQSNENVEIGESILFFGCRYKEKDFLYHKELVDFTSSGVLTSLHASFSRDPAGLHTRYVQENMRKVKEHLMELIFEKHCAVYICGDAKFMGRDVTNLFIEFIEEYKQVSKLDAMGILKELRDTKQFLEDVWT